jgi:hypothetical protein
MWVITGNRKLRELVDICVMAELVTRTCKHKL